MPALEKHQSSETTKMLLIGDSGTGKTGALASLALAGYNLRILDFDNGLDVLFNLLKGTNAISNVYYETLTDEIRAKEGKPVPKTARVWPNAVKLLSHWKTDEYDLGPVQDWTPKDVLVLDSLTFLGHAAMRYHLMLNSRLGGPIQLQDWNFVQSYIRDLLSMLYDKSIKCNVVVISHIKYMYEEKQDPKGKTYRELVKGFPNAPGRELPPQVGAYFNSMLQVVVRGTARWVLTQPQGVMGLKNANPGKVQKEYKLESALAQYFEDVRK